MTTISVAVSKLAHSPRNVRAPSEADDTRDLEATILDLGLINPPTAHPMPRGRYGVVAGGRRLLALQRLIARGDLPKTHAIDIIVRDDDDAKLTEISFAENEVRVALPAVTEFRTYQRLADDGADIAAIARRYQVTELHVRQRMRLGQLHPAILDELAAERLTLDLAKAYAATTDQELQKRVFDQRPSHAYEIRSAMKRDAVSAGAERMLSLVGIDAYAAAGGRAEEDLFTAGESRLLDVDVLKRLYDEKLAAELARLAVPAQATLQFDFGGVGQPIETAPLSDADWSRAAEIDGLVEDLECKLADTAEWDDDGPIGRYVAVAGGDQGEVDRIAADRRRLLDESEALSAAGVGGIDGPVIAVVEVVDLRLRSLGLYRPHGWTIGTSIAAQARADMEQRIAARGATAPANKGAAASEPGRGGSQPTPPIKAVVNGFRSDRHGMSGVYRQPEEVAKEQHGLTRDAVDAMRSHQRQILQAVLLGDPFGEKLAGAFLIFVLARDLLRVPGPDDYRRDDAGQLGVDRLPSRDFDPVHVRAELAGQAAGTIVTNALERLRASEWMTEPDIDAAFRKFSLRPFIEQQRAAAAVAAAMLNRSLGVPGFTVPIHLTIAEFLGVSTKIRRWWTPDAAFFARLSKAAKVEAITVVDAALAKRVSGLGTDDLTAAAALIMTGSTAAVEQFGMSPEARDRAKGWVPPYLSLDQPGSAGDGDDDQEEAA